MRVNKERDYQNETYYRDDIPKRQIPILSHSNRFTASSVGSIIGADRTACIAARTSLRPLPVFNTRIGSLLPTTSEPAALTKPAYAVAPAGSAKTPTVPNSAMALRISSSDTLTYVPPVSFAARTALTPSRGRSTEMLSAMVLAETGVMVSVFAWNAFEIAAEPSACTPMMRGM